MIILFMAIAYSNSYWKQFVGAGPACVVGALAPYNHGVPLAGALACRILATWRNGYAKLTSPAWLPFFGGLVGWLCKTEVEVLGKV